MKLIDSQVVTEGSPRSQASGYKNCFEISSLKPLRTALHKRHSSLPHEYLQVSLVSKVPKVRLQMKSVVVEETPKPEEVKMSKKSVEQALRTKLRLVSERLLSPS
jgi:hypothetical protein